MLGEVRHGASPLEADRGVQLGPVEPDGGAQPVGRDESGLCVAVQGVHVDTQVLGRLGPVEPDVGGAVGALGGLGYRGARVIVVSHRFVRSWLGGHSGFV